MSKTLLRSLVVLSTLLPVVTAISAFADCPAPATQGIKICFPTEGSTVMYAPAIEMSANTGSATVVKSELYDNGKLVDTNPFLPGTLEDGGIKNGAHKVTVRILDSNGVIRQASRSFNVTGFGVGFCARPSTAGVSLCWPQQGSTQPNLSVPISASARGTTAKITSLSVYVDGKFLLGTAGDQILTGTGMSAGTHRVAVVAKDAAGQTYKTAHTFTTYYNYDCNPKSGACSPGIVLNNFAAPDVPNSFRLNADVVNNPSPTTSMKVYLDGVVVATSTGPGITKQFTLATGSTHIIWVKATDTQNKQYATYQTIYVH